MASANAIKGGSVFIEVFADSAEASKAIAGLQKDLNKFAANAAKTGLVLSGMGAAITAPLVIATKAFASFGDSIDKMSSKTGQSAENLTALGFAAEMSGASLDGLDTGIKKFYENLSSASRGGKEATDSLKALGLEAKDLVGQPLPEQLAKVAGGMKRLASDEDRAAKAAALFGKAGYNLLPMLKGGEEEMRELSARASELGAIMGQEQVKAAARLDDAMTEVQWSLKGLNNSIGYALEPMATALAKAAAETVAWVSELVKAHPALVNFAAGIGGVVAALGSLSLALAGIGKGLAFAITGFQSLGGVLKPLVGAGGLLAKIGGGAAMAAFAAKAAVAAGAVYGVYKALEAVLGKADKLGKVGLEVTDANPEKVSKLSDRARQYASPESGGSRAGAFADYRIRTDELKEQLLQEKRLLEQIENARGLSEGFGVTAGMGRQIAAMNSGVNFDDNALSASKDKIAALNAELADVQQTMIDMGDPGQWNENFWETFFAPDEQQVEQYKKTLDDIEKKEKAVRDARSERNENRIFENMIAQAPQAAATIIGEKADQTAAKEAAIQAEVLELKKKQATVDKEGQEAINERLAVLALEAEAAAKATDRMEDFRRKNAAALDEAKKRARDLVDTFDKMKGDRLRKTQEEQFRRLLDSGDWKTANEMVAVDMAKLAAEWAKNMAEVDGVLEDAMAGNTAAIAKLVDLQKQQQALESRGDELKARKGDVGIARDASSERRLAVIRHADPLAAGREIAGMIADLKKEFSAAFAEASRIEKMGGNADTQYKNAYDIQESLARLQEEGGRTDYGQQAVMGTFSAAAANRMGGGAGVVNLMRQQLEAQRLQIVEQQNTNKKLDDLNRKAETGGLGY